MTGCSNWADAIADCALGEPPGTELTAHLALCPQCRSAFEASRVMAARIDDVLNRRADVGPPVYGPERVMARINAQSNARAWWPVVLASTIAMIAIVIWVRRPAPITLSTWRSPTEVLLRPPVAAAWAMRPNLGEGFFEIKPSGEIHAQ